MHRAFQLAAQYICLAHALQPEKPVYEQSLRIVISLVRCALVQSLLVQVHYFKLYVFVAVVTEVHVHSSLPNPEARTPCLLVAHQMI